MKTLAIETSCDDTSLAVVVQTETSFVVEKILSYSQVKTHQVYGGVVPEIASREHAQQILHVLFHLIVGDIASVELAHNTHNNTSDGLLRSLSSDIVADFFSDIDCISVTVSPGLPGSLCVGRSIAQFLSQYFNKPLVPVNHIHGHIFSLLLERDISAIKFPLMVLTASGGHNELYLVHDKLQHGVDAEGSDVVGSFSIRRIGQSLDDAAGESFDKVSRMLGGPYPGGQRISQQAEQGKEREDIHCTRIFLNASEYNFSFSGMKSQVYRIIENFKEQGQTLTQQDIADISYAFQESVVEVLAKKLVKSAIAYKTQSVALAGGVSANTRLKEYISDYITSLQGKKQKNSDGVMETINVPVFLGTPTKLLYCTDNAAMIGVVGLLTATEKN